VTPVNHLDSRAFLACWQNAKLVQIISMTARFSGFGIVDFSWSGKMPHARKLHFGVLFI
jgi:hypothetical protein